MRERHVLADGKGSGDGDEAEQPVLELSAFVGGCGTGEGLEPRVDLQRVGGYGNGFAAARAEKAAEGDCNGGLANPRRTKECNDHAPGRDQ
jgi:hypothetical protein